MSITRQKKEDSRIELRISKDDKEFFEYASKLRGFKSFSVFARMAIYKEARAIVEAEKSILVSKRDQEIFFNALLGNEEKPNKDLISAIKLHNELVTR